VKSQDIADTLFLTPFAYRRSRKKRNYVSQSPATWLNFHDEVPALSYR
jgi:hypothetical protein